MWLIEAIGQATFNATFGPDAPQVVDNSNYDSISGDTEYEPTTRTSFRGELKY